MTPSLPKISVNRKAAERVASGHPWIFRSDVTGIGDAAPGSAVNAVDPRGRSLGTAHYSSTSNIALRMLSGRITSAGRDFFETRIAEADAHRTLTVRDTSAWRMVFGEADRLPGLVIDRYGETAVIQALSQGMDAQIETIATILVETYGMENVVARNDVAVRKHEDLPLGKHLLRGSIAGPVRIQMNGLDWRVDPLKGQKTGIFLDQRENYLAAARWGRGRALDCFTCAGGFALHLARSCDSVEAIDSSATSLEIARDNAAANSISNVTFRQADAFDLLSGYAKSRRTFETVVLDPPAFAKDRRAAAQALDGYREINRRALSMLSPGGILITCSCSHHVSEEALLDVLAKASIDSGRPLRVLERRYQALDHPVLLAVPETLYLKCLIVQASN